MNDNVIGIIPARWASTRFPGKPLALLGGKPMIEHVWLHASQALSRVVVATDDERIRDAVTAFGGEAVMTSSSHRSGTDRCLEAYKRCARGEQIVVNIQGDEPFVDPRQIISLVKCFERPDTDIATLVRPFAADGSFEDLSNPNRAKVVVGRDGHAIFFSRQVIPHVRGKQPQQWPAATQYYTHVGMYAYRAHVLEHIAALQPSPLELAESLEQLRWLENGLTIATAVTTIETIGIDTPEDLAHAQEHLSAIQRDAHPAAPGTTAR